MLDDHERADGYTAARASTEGRRRLGSMMLLGNHVRIGDLLSVGEGNGLSRPTPASILSGRSSPSSTPIPSPSRDGHGGGCIVPSPEVVHCHEEITYHFSRDALVFLPGERSLPWLPASFHFSHAGNNGATDVPTAAESDDLVA